MKTPSIRRATAALAILACLLIAPGHAEAQPENDACGTAVEIFDGFTAFSTVGATDDGAGDCGITSDVWFFYRAISSGPVTVDTCEGTSFDSALAVYAPNDEGNCPAFALVGCNDDDCGSLSRLTFAATGGLLYTIRVGSGAAAPSQGDGMLRVLPGNPPAAPENDQCANARPIRGGETLFSTALASTDGPGDCIAINDVWFRLHAYRDGFGNVGTCGSSFDTVIAAYEDVCSEENFLGCNDDACGRQSLIFVIFHSGHDYLIRVGGFDGEVGDGVLTIDDLNVGTCPVDWNGADGVDSQDFFDFLDDLFAGEADFQGDGLTDSQDFFDFLDAFFGGCP